MTKKILYISAACFLLITAKLSAMGEDEFTKYVKGKEFDVTKLKKNIISKLKSARMKKDTEYYKRIIKSLNNKNEAQSFRQILNNAIKKEIINMVKYFTYEKNLSFFTFSTAENKEAHRKNKAEMRDIAIRFWNTLPNKWKNNKSVLNEFAIKEKEGFLTDVYNENYLKNNNKKKQREAFDFLKSVLLYKLDNQTDEKIKKSTYKLREQIKNKIQQDRIKLQQKRIKSLEKQINRQKQESLDKMQNMQNILSIKDQSLSAVQQELKQQGLDNYNKVNKFGTNINRLQRELDEKIKLINELEAKNKALASYFVDEEYNDDEASTEDDTDVEYERLNYDNDNAEEDENDGGQTISSTRIGRSLASRNPERRNVRRPSLTRRTANRQTIPSKGRRRISSRSNPDNNPRRGRQSSSSRSRRPRNIGP